MPLIREHIARRKGWIHKSGPFAGQGIEQRAIDWLDANDVTPHHDPITGQVILIKRIIHAIPHTGDAHRLRQGD